MTSDNVNVMTGGSEGELGNSAWETDSDCGRYDVSPGGLVLYLLTLQQLDSGQENSGLLWLSVALHEPFG